MNKGRLNVGIVLLILILSLLMFGCGSEKKAISMDIDGENMTMDNVGFINFGSTPEGVYKGEAIYFESTGKDHWLADGYGVWENYYGAYYDGNWKRGFFHGEGTLTFKWEGESVTIFATDWTESVPGGTGSWSDDSGTKEGTWKDGELVYDDLP